MSLPRKRPRIAPCQSDVNGFQVNSATALSPHDAIRKVLDLSGESSDHGTITALWREYQESRTWKELAKRTAPVRANREIAVLSNLMELAIRRGMLDVNPCRQIRRNKENRDPETCVLMNCRRFWRGVRDKGSVALYWPQWPILRACWKPKDGVFESDLDADQRGRDPDAESEAAPPLLTRAW